MKQRVKLDYNHLLELIDETFSKNDTETIEKNAFGITIGLELLSSFMKEIAERAIEINDEVLIDILKDLCVLKEKESGVNG